MDIIQQQETRQASNPDQQQQVARNPEAASLRATVERTLEIIQDSRGIVLKPREGFEFSSKQPDFSLVPNPEVGSFSGFKIDYDRPVKFPSGVTGVRFASIDAKGENDVGYIMLDRSPDGSTGVAAVRMTHGDRKPLSARDFTDAVRTSDNRATPVNEAAVDAQRHVKIMESMGYSTRELTLDEMTKYPVERVRCSAKYYGLFKKGEAAPVHTTLSQCGIAMKTGVIPAEVTETFYSRLLRSVVTD